MRVPDLLDKLGIRYVGQEHKHGRPGWVQVCCPWCDGGHQRYHLGIALGTATVNCWRCGRHRLGDALAAITGRSVADVLRLADGLDLRTDAAPVRPMGRLVLPGGLLRLDHAEAAAHRRYLAGRGFDPAHLARLWGLGAIGLAPRLAWRIFIPVYLHGKVVSWTTRAIGDRVEQRYVSASAEEEALPHRSLLYGEDYCRGAVIVHEGPADVWATGPGAVATLGTSYNQAQLARLSHYAVRAICFDNEPAAQRRASQLARDLSAFPGETLVVQLEAKDAGSAHPDEIAELRQAVLGELA